jgi:hypothetical protein
MVGTWTHRTQTVDSRVFSLVAVVVVGTLREVCSPVIDWLQGFLIGGLLIAVTVLAIHDQQTLATLKRMHLRIKMLESK